MTAAFIAYLLVGCAYCMFNVICVAAKGYTLTRYHLATAPLAVALWPLWCVLLFSKRAVAFAQAGASRLQDQIDRDREEKSRK